jgi:hypothetical protein
MHARRHCLNLQRLHARVIDSNMGALMASCLGTCAAGSHGFSRLASLTLVFDDSIISKHPQLLTPLGRLTALTSLVMANACIDDNWWVALLSDCPGSLYGMAVMSAMHAARATSASLPTGVCGGNTA